MAITLEELFGKNIQKPTEKVETFPSFEEFASRNSSSQSIQNSVGSSQNNQYDYFAKRQYVQPMTTDEVREYNASHAFSRPQQHEFNSQYLNGLVQQQETLPPADVSLDNEFAPRYGNVEYKPLSLFEFTAHDHDRLSNGELDSKLSYSANNQMFMAFNGEIAAKPTVQPTQKVKKEKNKVKLHIAHFAHKEKEEKQRKLSIKGKIAIGVYIALIVTVVILIGVNAKKINNGLSIAPTGNTQIEQIIEG